MKKTFKSLLAIGIAAFALASCSDVPEPYTIPGQASQGGGNLPEGTIMSTDFKANGPSNWKSNDVLSPTAIEDVWTYNSKYGMVATASQNSGANNYASESWLVSPEIDLSGKESAFLILSHAGNYFTNISNECSVLISADYGTRSIADEATWEKLEITNWPTSFTYVESVVNISKYAGKKVNLAFKYTSTDTKAGTWEIGSVTIAESEPEDPNNYGTQDAPITVAEALAILSTYDVGKTSAKNAYIIGKIAEIPEGADAPGNTYGNATYKISADGQANDMLTVYRGYGLGEKTKIKEGDIKVGDEVIVCGKLENHSKGGAQVSQGSYLVKLNDKVVEPEPEETIAPESGTGTDKDPFNVARAVAKCKEAGETATENVFYVEGIVSEAYTVDNNKNATLVLTDEGFTQKFTAYRVKGLVDGAAKNLKQGYVIPKGAKVLVCGKLVNYKSNTPETSNGSLIKVNNQAPEYDEGASGGGEGGGEAVTSLTNGDFETWAEGQPTGWKSASTASSATLEQSTDKHGGNYAVLVKGGGSSNKRLASQEITLAAGDYNFSFWVKATSENKAQVRAGYVPVTNGTTGNYSYKTDYNNISTTWSQVSYDFTLSTETTICLVVMNPKSGSYSSGEDVIVDDATLTKK
jgi:hypothetical protein